MSILFLDTNIISDMMRDLRGLAATKAKIASVSRGYEVLYTSTIVQCELEYGLLKKESSRLQSAYVRVMESIEILPVDSSIAADYAKLRTTLERLGTPIGANDTLIAAHALALGATLVTADAEFSRVPGLKIENWLQPL
jgi:tRNA(fMet)-specific endonuclease VapC